MNYPTLNARRYSADFPIHREQPLELRNSFGLTFPPRAGVLVPKTQIFQTLTNSRFDRLVFTILIAWFSQSLRRLCCFVCQHIRTIAPFLGSGSFRLCGFPLPHAMRHRLTRTPQLNCFDRRQSFQNVMRFKSGCSSQAAQVMYAGWHVLQSEIQTLKSKIATEFLISPKSNANRSPTLF